MSLLPAAPTRTWQYDRNNSVAASGSALTDHRQVLKDIIDALLAFATAPCTCLGSSDSTTAGLDTVNRLDALAKFVWDAPGNAHSWIVLKQTALSSTGQGWQLLISCENADANGKVLTVYHSVSAGFTGGSTTDRPTATDEQAILANVQWLTASGTSVGPIVWNVQLCSVAGSGAIRIFAFYNDFNILYASFERYGNVQGTQSYPVICSWFGGTTASDVALSSAFMSTGVYARPVSNNVNARYSALAGNLGNADAAIQTSWSVYSGFWPADEIWISDTTNICRLGKIVDLYFGSTNAAFATYPSDGSFVWGTVGNVIVPTGGTQLVTH